jgi:peptidyl-prolyl cis-trans isomerase C
MDARQHGCGGGSCQCVGDAVEAPPAIDGVALLAPGEQLSEEELRERAWAELLRQEAVRRGLLPKLPVHQAPLLTAADEAAIDRMLLDVIPHAAPGDDECRRYYEARRHQFVEGRRANVRHILFAVTPGVDVQALARRAEIALLELGGNDVDPVRFGALARELSNCPSGADGGALGWLAPRDCADELAQALFGHDSPQTGLGLQPRLVHSRYGFHIVDVLGREAGRQAGFEEVRERIATQLAQQSRARALHQYIRLLAGCAQVEGIELERAETPLVQ